MNEEIDDSEFYHQDFTTASEWEIFIARIEEIINQWKTEDQKNDSMQKDDISYWDIRSEKLNFIDTNFELLFYRKNIEEEKSESSDEKSLKHPIDTWFNFELHNEQNFETHSYISKWYGLNEYIVLSPSGNVGITNESKIKILLSSATVVVGNLNCEIPFFVQIREKWQNLYLGLYENEGLRTNFEMVHLQRGPNSCQYLNGILGLFKTKIMSPCSIEDIIISLQSSYLLSNFGHFVWKQDTDLICSDVENIFLLPFGVTVDPIHSLVLKTTWPHFGEHSVIDREHYSDLQPKVAPQWSCTVNMTKDPVCLLGDALSEFCQLLNNTTTTYDVLGDFASLPSPPESNPLDVLTEPAVPTISSLLSRAARNSLARNKKNNPPINENILVPLLYFLFPDADENGSYPYGGREDKELPQKKVRELFKNTEEEFKGFKTCSADTLIWRLVIVLVHSLQSLGGLKAFSHIWYEFVQEMRYRWEKSMLIPGLAPGFPDLRTCLLNQKLQMLNSCIERKITRENLNASRFDSAENSDNSDDEFFDCDEKDDEEVQRREKLSLWNQPVGRLSKFGDMKLLKTGDPLYIPITQEPVLKTEDQLEEDTDVLLKLGSDQEASELRARIMSASLLSDMESFKAANPGSVVEDFIRWYSPRDWIEEEELDEFGQKKGQLSPRMQLDNNIWVQMWQSAKPVPANRQKRLFDDTREAEKILQFLDLRTVGQIAELVIPVLCHSAICRLIDELENSPTEIAETTLRIASLLKHGERISRDNKIQPRRFEVFTQEVTTFELLISQANSLQYKLNPSGDGDNEVNGLIGQLVDGKEVKIPNKERSLMGSRIVSMFTESQIAAAALLNDFSGDNGVATASEITFPQAFEREFVLRANAVKPALCSARCPQYLRAFIGKNEFRLAGAFSEDTVFF